MQNVFIIKKSSKTHPHRFLASEVRKKCLKKVLDNLSDATFSRHVIIMLRMMSRRADRGL